jgi:hypothetical protein
MVSLPHIVLSVGKGESTGDVKAADSPESRTAAELTLTTT